MTTRTWKEKLKTVNQLLDNIREPIIYIGLIVFLAVFMVLELQDQSQETVFYEKFDAAYKDISEVQEELNTMHEEVISVNQSLEEFLKGWSKYDNIIAKGEARIVRSAEEGQLPMVSCESVFIREHVVNTCE